MSIEKIFFEMTTQNSTENQTISPEALMSELGIKKTKYYEILKHLDIKADKDLSGNIYLTIEKAEKVRAYLSGNIQTAENDESTNNSSLVKADNNNLAASTNNNSEENIYIEAEEPFTKLDSGIVREAEELAARGMAMNDLIKIQLASQMSFEDLSPDLQEKVKIAREVANPKFTPAAIAGQLLAQHRSQKAQVQG
jgi:hypothetical protein